MCCDREVVRLRDRVGFSGKGGRKKGRGGGGGVHIVVQAAVGQREGFLVSGK